MKQINWFERKFDFSGSQNILPSVIERLWGTPLRLEAKLKIIPPEVYTIRVGDKWSVLEHIGHLSDLEPLWQGRLEDILQDKPVLRPTDLQNTRTHQANHNAKTPEQLLEEFRALREITLSRLNSLTEDQVFKSASHPRLNTPMSVIDLFLFVAEHDDHHLANITEINKKLSAKDALHY